MLKAVSAKMALLVTVISMTVFGFGSVAHAAVPTPDDNPNVIAAEAQPPVPEPAPGPAHITHVVTPEDTFSGLVQTYCGTSNWPAVAFPGRDKNLIINGETIEFTCPLPGAVVVPEPAPAPAPQPTANAAACGGQTPNSWNQEQRTHAATIVHVGVNRGVPRRGLIIALMTAMQESTLHNYGYLGNRNDHDSQGLFQQRPSMGWGTVAQVTDPVHAANKFYDGLMNVRNWQNMQMTLAAQAVQISAYPYAYAKWERDATILVDNC